MTLLESLVQKYVYHLLVYIIPDGDVARFGFGELEFACQCHVEAARRQERGNTEDYVKMAFDRYPACLPPYDLQPTPLENLALAGAFLTLGMKRLEQHAPRG